VEPIPEKEIVTLLMGVVWQSLYSKSQHVMTMARDSLKFLARKSLIFLGKKKEKTKFLLINISFLTHRCFS